MITVDTNSLGIKGGKNHISKQNKNNRTDEEFKSCLARQIKVLFALRWWKD